MKLNTHMNKLTTITLAALLLAPLAALHAEVPMHRDDPAQTGDFTINLSDIRVRDPFIVADRASKTYYLYAQCGNRQNNDSLGLGVEVYASKDLVKWSAPRLAFERPKSGFWGGSDIWAPEVHQFGKGYFMFVTFPGRAGGRGTQILRADRPEGPFQILGDSANTPPEEQCLDGTPWIDEHGVHWMVYCNEWTSIKDGTVRAVPMTDDWTARKGESILLFRASEAPWVRTIQPGKFVTDGPFLHRAKSGKLLMIWSSFVKGHGYGVGQAISKSGSVAGPWVHLEKPLVGGGGEDGGHCMIFRDFSGELLLAFHQPNGGSRERSKIYRLKEENDALVLNGALLPTTTGYAKEPTKAFLMAYFVGDSVEENRMHLCWSLDGLKWTALNNDKPVVTSSMSTKAIRDPAILRKEDGSFVLMYTDAAWSVGQKHTCGFWDSPDLVNWSNQRIRALSSDPAVPAWGPEAIYDPATGKYIVLWSTAHSDSLWFNTTTDFDTFSPEAQFFSPGHQVLENNIIQHGEYYYLIYKDERGGNNADTPYKALKVARSKSLTPGSFTILTEDYISPHLSEGPVICKAINADRWYLYYDMFMEGGIFKCATTTNLNGNTTDWSTLPDNQFSLPKRVRNAHILEIDREELIRLRDVWDNGPNFAGGCKASASSAMEGSPASNANDLNYNTYWSAAVDKGANEWLEINLGTNRTFNKTVIRQSNSDRITGYKIQYHNGTEWLDAYTGGSMGNKVKIDTFPPVTSSRVRLLVTKVQPGAAVAGGETATCPQINEFDIYLNPQKLSNEGK
jgi:beta-xylosidase